jgi:PAS domain S-box-containing protein
VRYSPGEQIETVHVGDDPDITDLTATYLERESDRISAETAHSPKEGLERVNEHPPDCIVSEYSMPGMDGIGFLREVREDHPDLPFILFTGKGSEAVASQAISAGVTDYLQKGSGSEQYELLANRIENAVSAHRSGVVAEQRRHRLEQILKTVPGCVVQLDPDGQFVFANEHTEDVLGLERDDVAGRVYNDPNWDIQGPDGDPVPDEKLPFRKVRDEKEPIYAERLNIQWPDGTRKLLLVNGAPVFDDNGEFESAVFSLTDITQQKERERKLRSLKNQYETLVESFPDGGGSSYSTRT